MSSLLFAETLWRDACLGMRSLAKRPLLLITATLSIAVGVGINVSVYRAVTYVFFEMSLSGAAPDARLVGISGEFSFPNYNDLRSADAFTGVAAMQVGTLIWRTDTGATRVSGKVVSTNYFDVIDVRPIYGRVFHEGDDSQSVVLGFSFWQRRLGGDPSVVGRTVNINGWPYVISGILARNFYAPVAPMVAADVYVPIGPQVTNGLTNRGASQFDLAGRLRDGATMAQARLSLTKTATEIERQFPREAHGLARSLQVYAETGIDQWRNLFGREFGLVITAAATVYSVISLVLLIACANVAGLLLARAEERRREIAICAALGATPRRLVQRFMAESAIIAATGCVAGAGLYLLVMKAIASIVWTAGSLNVMPLSTPLIYCGALIAIVTLACGTAPALVVGRIAPSTTIASAGANTTRHRGVTRNFLVVLQVAVCFVLLSGGFVLLRGVWHLHSVDPGFDVARTLSLSVRMPVDASGTREPAARTFQRIRNSVTQLPGVESVSSVRYLPLMPLTWRASVHTPTAVDRHLAADIHPVGPRYLETVRIPLRSGRDFTDDDVGAGRGTATPIIVNETLAQRFFGSPNALGRQLVLERADGDADRLLLVVGVARDSKLRSLNEDSHPVLYLPELSTSFVIRTAGPAFASSRDVEKAVADSEAGASVEATPMRDRVGTSFLPLELGGGMLTALGALGLLIAMIGLYALVSYSVNRRKFEIGVRLALGAQRADVIRMIVREALVIIGAGCAIGLVIVLALGQALSSLLPAQKLTDPIALGSVIAVLLFVGGASSLWPARRAARVDPIVALRHD